MSTTFGSGRPSLVAKSEKLTSGSSAFAAGGLAACGAVTVSHPFEVIKIRYVYARALSASLSNCSFRLQLQGELQAKRDAPKLYRGVLHGVRVVRQNEGLRGLFRGIGSAVR